ncbi:MAG: LptF/LptG family permease [Planctomycetota bacterium]|jgi:lipopolysaccharide export system permease protein|nr:LptF/LptG family permease [Blastopirellula sp.]
MGVVDRYLLQLFVKILAVCFVSLSGLFVVVHLFTNLDDFQNLADQTGGSFKLAMEFYGPRLLDLFDRTAPILVLLAAVSALALMQRKQELTAIEAAGIPRGRLFRTLILGSLAVLALTVVNREVWVPQYRHELTGTLQNWRGSTQTLTHFQKDHTTGIRISGQKLIYDQAQITEPVVQIPYDVSSDVPRILARSATFLEATDERPAGLMLEGIVEPTQADLLQSLDTGEGTLVFVPPNHLWLKPQEVFIRSTLSLDEFAYGQSNGEYAALGEMMEAIRRPAQWYSAGNRISLHARIVRPVIDLTLLLVALPLALLFSERNLFLAAAVCVGAVVAFQVAMLVSNSLGSLSLIKSSALAAWLPVIAFLPLTVFTLRLVNR